MSIISPKYPTVKLPLGPCWVRCCRWQCLELRLHGVHFYNNIYKVCHDCWFGTGKVCIGLCQYFQIVTMCMHSLDDSVQVVYVLVVLFWWGCRYTLDILYHRCVPPFSFSGDHSTMISMISVEKGLESGPCLDVGGLPSPLFDVLVEGDYLFQKCDIFVHHHCVVNRLPSCTRELSPLF